MMRKTLSFIFILACFSKGLAQEAKELTFTEAIKIALKNNVDLQQQKNLQYVNQARKSSSIAQMAPAIQGFAQGSKVQGNQFIEQEARVVNDARTTNFYGSLEGSVTLFNGLNRIKSIQQASAQLDAQQYLVQRTEQDVITDVANQYLQCLLDQELLDIAQKNLEYQETLMNQLTEQVSAGSRAEVDQITQEAQTKNAELLVLRARFTLRNDKVTLSQILQLDPVEILTLAEPGWDISSVDFEAYSLEALYSQALQNRSDLMQSELNEDAARYGITMAKSSYWPFLSMFGSINSRYSDASVPEFDTQIDDNLRKEYGLQLTIPIFNGLQSRSSVVRAKVDYSNAKLNTKSTEIQVKSDVLRAYQNFKDATSSYQVAESAVRAAELSYQLEHERYQLGASDLVQDILASQNYYTIQGNYAQAKYTLLFQDLLLKYALGTLKVEDIP